jgi:hypothetical protein
MIFAVIIFALCTLYGFVAGWHAWNIALMVLCGLCMLGLGKPRQAQPDNAVNSRKNIRARKIANARKTEQQGRRMAIEQRNRQEASRPMADRVRDAFNEH